MNGPTLRLINHAIDIGLLKEDDFMLKYKLAAFRGEVADYHENYGRPQYAEPEPLTDSQVSIIEHAADQAEALDQHLLETIYRLVDTTRQLKEMLREQGVTVR